MVKYKFSNKLMFAIVMQDKEICKTFIERLLPDKRVKSVRFPERSSDETASYKTIAERSIVTGLLSKSVRLDVLFEDGDSWYDIEMQIASRGNLPKRSRYYHTAMSKHLLPMGEHYENLKNSYVIFICLYDEFGMDEPIYNFEMYDKNLQLQLGDGSYTIVLDIKCSKDKVPQELEPFFTYMDTGEVDENDLLIKRIHDRVEQANEDEEVTQIMTLEEEMKIEKQYAYREGVERGIEQGRSEGEQVGLERGAAQKQREIAKNMKALDIQFDKITQATGLSIAEIEKL